MTLILKFLFFFLALASCEAGKTQEDTVVKGTVSSKSEKYSDVEIYFLENKNDSIESQTTGSPGNGTLKHGTLIPFSGSNYDYFDQESYLKGRGFMHRDVASILLHTFEKLEKVDSTRTYVVMECSNENGGKLEPHRTHQNGLSVDLLCLKQKNNLPFIGLDSLGLMHYFTDFDEHGNYLKDKSISLDFEAISKEMYFLNLSAKEFGYKIEKIIFMLELKDELFATEYGQKLKAEGVYFAKNLSDMVNKIHDDHFHVDFVKIKN